MTKLIKFALTAFALISSGNNAATAVAQPSNGVIPKGTLPLQHGHNFSHLREDFITNRCSSLPILPAYSYAREFNQNFAKILQFTEDIEASIEVVQAKIASNEPQCEALALDTLKYLLAHDPIKALSFAQANLQIDNPVAKKVTSRYYSQLTKNDEGDHLAFITSSLKYNTDTAYQIAEGELTRRYSELPSHWKNSQRQFPEFYSADFAIMALNTHSTTAQKILSKYQDTCDQCIKGNTKRGMSGYLVRRAMSDNSPQAKFIWKEHLSKYPDLGSDCLVNRILNNIGAISFVEAHSQDPIFREFIFECLSKERVNAAEKLVMKFFNEGTPEERHEIFLKSLDNESPQAKAIVTKFLENPPHDVRGLYAKCVSAFNDEAKKAATAYFDKLLSEDADAAFSFAVDALYAKSANPFPTDDVMEHIKDKLMKINELRTQWLIVRTQLFIRTRENWSYVVETITDASNDHPIVASLLNAVIGAGALLGIAKILHKKLKKARETREVNRLKGLLVLVHGRIIDELVNPISSEQDRKQIFTFLNSIPQADRGLILTKCLESRELFPRNERNAVTLRLLRVYTRLDESATRFVFHERLRRFPPNRRNSLVQKVLDGNLARIKDKYQRLALVYKTQEQTQPKFQNPSWKPKLRPLV